MTVDLPQGRDVENDPAVQVDGFGYRFAERDEPTLHDVCFSLPRGSFTVVAGRTGSGKSTLLRALAGLIPHHSSGVMDGTIRIAGHDTRRMSSAELASLVGLILQSPDDQICTTSVEAEIAFGLENLALDPKEIAGRIQAALIRFGLVGLRGFAPGELSGGLRQRLVLAAVAAMHPQVLVCDEPLSQLDPQSARSFLEELKRMQSAGTTVIVAEHHLSEVLPHADRVLVVDDGRLTADVATSDEARVASVLKPLRFDDRTPRSVATAKARTESPLVATLSGISLHYPNGIADVWHRLNAEIRRGERIALVGPNGSGKSSLLAVLAGALPSTEGRLQITAAADRWPATLVPQQVDLTLFSRNVRDELAYGPRQLRLNSAMIEQRVMAAAQRFQLEPLLTEPPQALSRGQRVRTALAAAFACRPTLLLLDEPTTGQDAPTIAALMASLCATVGTVDGPDALVFSTHQLSLARRYADRVWLLRDGRLHEFAAADFRGTLLDDDMPSRDLPSGDKPEDGEPR
ncbi:MAG: ABC transporter ATP-binding protein [Pirellulales bacterium]